MALALMVALGAGVETSSSAAAGQPSEPEVAQTLQNVLRWSTASEVDNFGFDVFRALAEDGPFSRLNETPIAGHGTTDVPHQYEYRDTTIAADTVYWYYVESISLQGERERFTPVFSARPKSR